MWREWESVKEAWSSHAGRLSVPGRSDTFAPESGAAWGVSTWQFCFMSATTRLREHPLLPSSGLAIQTRRTSHCLNKCPPTDEKPKQVILHWGHSASFHCLFTYFSAFASCG